jgi:hypothetical protein
MMMMMRKKIIIVIISIVLVLFIAMFVMTVSDRKYFNDIIRDIELNTDIENIDYVNFYDDYYLVVDSEYLYLINSQYEEITKIDLKLTHDNVNHYDIIYRDNTIMYMKNYKSKKGLVFEYYDLKSYELIDKIVVGGSYG